MALISAHQCGAPKGAPDSVITEALEAVLTTECDYVEVDVRRTADGALVVRHDARVAVGHGHHPRVATLTLDELRQVEPALTTYDEVLDRLHGRKSLHLDLKFGSPRELYEDTSPKECHEVAAVERAIAVLGADKVVVTTGNDHAVAALRAWSAARYPDLLVGLSLGKSRAGLPLWEQLRGRLSELFPGHRVLGSNANLVVANHWLAYLGVARWTAKRGLPLVVWTVDGRRGLTRWLGDPRAWLVTTNETLLAIEIRRRLDGSR